jgi:hypothetical protein
MADYPPPTQALPDFNPAVFRTNDTPLTITEAENYFLSFPIAQGTENLADVNVAGKLTSTRDAHNLGFGYQALSSAVDGSATDNTAFGYQALNALTIGDSNSAFGDLSFKNLGTIGKINFSGDDIYQKVADACKKTKGLFDQFNMVDEKRL